MKNSKKPMTLKDIANAQEKVKIETIQLKLLLKHLKQNPDLNVADWIEYNLQRKVEIKQNLKQIKLSILKWHQSRLQNELKQLTKVTEND